MNDKAGWRINEWREKVGGLDRSYVYKLIDQNEIKTVKVGKARIILTSPREFLERKASLNG